MKNIHAPIIVEGRYKSTLQKVWKAISDNKEIKKWHFEIEELKLIPGYEFEFTAGTDEKKYLHTCKIMEVVENKKLSYSWRYDGYSGDSLVTFELNEEGEYVHLKMTHDGVTSFPSGNADFVKDNFIAGWKKIIGTNLPAFLDDDVSEQKKPK